MVDVESDGPYPPKYSMIQFGAVVVNKPEVTVYGNLKPISKNYLDEALKVNGVTRDETLKFGEPALVMKMFRDWLNDVCHDERPMFISDNNGYDWQFMNYYLWEYTGGNPFGHSSTNLGSLYKGLVKDMKQNFKHLRRTKHTHNPVDDALGNVEAFNQMLRMGLK